MLVINNGFFKQRLIEKFPAMLVALATFFSVYLTFPNELLMATFMLAIFNLKSNSDFSFKDLIKTCFVLYLVVILVFITTINTFFLVALNFSIPFLLVLLFSNEFDLSGYFTYVMSYVFLQLKPISLEQLPNRFLALSCCCIILTLGLYLSKAYAKRKLLLIQLNKNAFINLSEQFYKIQAGLDISQEHEKLASIINQINQVSYHNKNTKYGNACYLLTLVLMRMSYFACELTNRKDNQSKDFLLNLSSLCQKIARNMNDKNNVPLILEISRFLASHKLNDPLLTHCFFYAMHNLSCVLEDIVLIKGNKKLVDIEKLKRTVGELNLKNYIFRFAIRISVVNVIAVTIPLIFQSFINVDIWYYVQLNSFMILAPTFEQSTQKMTNRIIGNIIGVIVISIISLSFPNSIFPTIILGIMFSLIYYWTPSSKIMVSYATCYGLALLSVKMNLWEGIFYRIFFVLVAASIVFLASKFLLPTTLHSIFKINNATLNDINMSLINKIRELVSNPQIVKLDLDGTLMTFNRILYDILEYAKTTFNHQYKLEYISFINMYEIYLKETEQIITAIGLNRLEEGDSFQIFQYLDYSSDTFLMKDIPVPSINTSDEYLNVLMEKNMSTIKAISNMSNTLKNYI